MTLAVTFSQANQGWPKAKDILGEPNHFKQLFHENEGRHFGDHRQHNFAQSPSCKDAIECTEEGLAEFKPRFNRLSSIVNMEPGSRHVQYNATTYRGHQDCPCELIEYRIVSEVNNKTHEPDDSVFVIDKLTGEVRLIGEMKPFAMIILVIEARNDVNDEADTTTLSVYRNSDEAEIMDQYNPFESQGYAGLGQLHHRQKRAISATDVLIEMIKLDDINDTVIGTTVRFQLNITIPNTGTDMRVELFAPDNETTIMILCNVNIDTTTYGSDLTIANNPPLVTYDSKVNLATQPDHAVIDFGDISVGSDTSPLHNIMITWEVITVENRAAQNGTYYASAGAEYKQQSEIWVGQTELTATFHDIVSNGVDDVTMNINADTTLAHGGVAAVEVNLVLPDAIREYVFRVSAPANTVGTVSVCSAWFDSWGENFVCGNDDAAIENSVTKDPQAKGNSVATVDLKTLLNKGSRVTPLNYVDSTVQLFFLVQSLDMSNPEIVLSLEVDESVIYVGSHTFTSTAAATTGFPTLGITANPATKTDAIIGKSFSILFTLTVPDSTNAGNLTVTVNAPFGTAPLYSLCSLRVTQHGRNLPCLISEDIETRFETDEVGGDTPHRAILALGFIKRYNRFTLASDDEIVIEAVVKPLTGQVSVGQVHTVTLDAVFPGDTPVQATSTITLSADSDCVASTNITMPDFTMNYVPDDDHIEETGDSRLLITMSTSRNTLYDQMDAEFLVPEPVDGVMIAHICKVEVLDTGMNLPCLNPAWENDRVDYFSDSNTEIVDRATMSFGETCNGGDDPSYQEDIKQFAMYVKFLHDPTAVTVETERTLSVGVQFAQDTLWTGIIKAIVRNTMNIPGDAFTYILGSTIDGTNIPQYYMGKYNVLYKIEPGGKVHLRFVVTSASNQLGICRVRILQVGDNLPCVANELSTWTAEHWSTGPRKSITMDLGVVNNYGDANSELTGNTVFDDNSILFSVTTNPVAPSVTNSFTVEAFTDTAMTLSTSISFTTSSGPLPVDTSVPTAVTAGLSVGSFVDDVISSDIAVGESKLVVFTLEIPEGSRYHLDVGFTIPAAFQGKIEICDAYVLSAGLNLPCIDYNTVPVYTYLEAFSAAVSFSFQYACSDVIRPGDQEANTLKVGAWVRLLPNGKAVLGETVTVTGTLLTFGQPTTVSVDSVNFVVQDASTHVNKVKYNPAFLPEMSLDNVSPLTVGIGEVITFTGNISVTPYSSYELMVDLDLPYDADSACMTFHDLRIISTGGNLLCVSKTIDAVVKEIVYEENVTDRTSTGQKSYVTYNFGTVVNTGKSYVFGDPQLEDNLIEVEIDVRMADCRAAVHGATFNMSIGAKITNVVQIAFFDVIVNRTQDEKPDFDGTFVAEASGSDVRLTGTIKHSLLSTAELWNAQMAVYMPITLETSGSITIFNGSRNATLDTTIDNPSVLVVSFDNFFFSDTFEFQTTVLRNTSIVYSPKLNFEDSVGYAEVLGNVTERNITSSLPYVTYPSWTSLPFNFPVAVNGSGPSCNDPLGMGDGNIQDCQIFSSITDQNPGHFGRLNSNTNYWIPFVRRGKLSERRYLMVYFCNPTTVTGITIRQGGADAATELEVSLSNDFRAWFLHQKITNIPAVYGTVTVPQPVSAKAFRVAVTNDTMNGEAPNILLKLELNGCYTLIDTTCTTVCTDAQAAADEPPVPDDFSVRNIAEGNMDELFVCDRDAETNLGFCKRTTDGDSWYDIDSNVGSMIGYDKANGRMFGYGQDRTTVYANEVSSYKWYAVDKDLLTIAKTQVSDWSPAIPCNETRETFFDNTFATTNYMLPSGLWGATFEGVYKVGERLVLKWACDN